MKLRHFALPVLLLIGASAHIGSNDVFFDGKAGPYQVNVRVFPPTVVPGTAWVYIRTSDADVDSVAVRPVFWKAGVKGAPPLERADTVAGEKRFYAQKTWLMSRGAYSIDVVVYGKRGQASATVPVMAIATRRLDLSTPLAVTLIALGMLLFAGLVAIVRAAASDSLVDPDREPDQVARRRGSLGAAITVPVLLVIVFGGARWWRVEDSSYQRTIYRPLAGEAIVATTNGGNTLRLAIRDTSGQNLLQSPVMLDHGKPMHLFLVKESSMSAFAHLHPVREAGGVFVADLPALPSGRYLVFADLALQTGASYTVATKVDVPAAIADTTADPDDSWIVDAFGVPAKMGARAALAPNLMIQWDTADSLVAGRDVMLDFSVRGRKDSIVTVEPYLGMAGHAILIRDDASVFVHLHPMGSMSMASLEAFDLRNRGDTTADGRLKDAMPMAMEPKELPGTLSFPFAFPQPGRYRLWVQVKKGGRVLTADYEVTVR